MKKLFNLSKQGRDLVEVWDLGGRRVRVELNAYSNYGTFLMRYWNGSEWTYLLEDKIGRSAAGRDEELNRLRREALQKAIMVLDGE